jgi:hypothetical protein
MPFSVVGLRRSLLTGAGLLVGSSAAIGVIVIPRLKAAFPPAAPERAAVPAFLLHIAFNLLVAMLLVSIGRRTPSRSRLSRIGLGVLACVVVLFGMALIDAAFAYYPYGAAMALASVALFVCSAAEVGAGLLSGGAALFVPTADVR